MQNQNDPKYNSKGLPLAKFISPVAAFIVPFVVVGSWNFLLIAMHGQAMPDEQMLKQQSSDCWFYFFLYGAIAGSLGLAIERFLAKRKKSD